MLTEAIQYLMEGVCDCDCLVTPFVRNCHGSLRYDLYEVISGFYPTLAYYPRVCLLRFLIYCIHICPENNRCEYSVCSLDGSGNDYYSHYWDDLVS